MAVETSSPTINPAEYSLFITTRSRHDTQVPDASREISARRMVERAWAESRGIDVTRAMGSDTTTGTVNDTTPKPDGNTSDKITTDPESPILF